MNFIDLLTCNVNYDKERVELHVKMYCPNHLNILTPYTNNENYKEICRYNQEHNIEDTSENECYECWHQEIKQE